MRKLAYGTYACTAAISASGLKVNRCHLTTAGCTNATTIAVHKIYSRNVEFPRPAAQAAVKAAALACPALSPSVAAIINMGWQKLSVVTNGAPEKGRRYHTFTHTERALVAIFDLSN